MIIVKDCGEELVLRVQTKLSMFYGIKNLNKLIMLGLIMLGFGYLRGFGIKFTLQDLGGQITATVQCTHHAHYLFSIFWSDSCHCIMYISHTLSFSYLLIGDISSNTRL